VKKLAAKHKVKILDTYWTMGRYDILVHFDAPNDEAMTAFTLDDAQQGNVRTETCRVFTREEFEGILRVIYSKRKGIGGTSCGRKGAIPCGPRASSASRAARTPAKNPRPWRPTATSSRARVFSSPLPSWFTAPK